jgi:hypothetical protein
MSRFPNSNFRRAGANTPLRPVQPKAKQPLKVEGDKTLWVTLQRVTDPDTEWTKTTRAMETPVGVLVNTCSRKKGTTFAAEALCLVPSTKLQKTTEGWKVVAS